MLTIRDVTEQLRAAEEIALRRIELTHLSRVSTRSELSVSIGHEINQPLQSILSNAQAALLFLAKESPDLDEIREILRDIVLDSRRAGEIMQKLRALLYKDESPFESLDLNEVVQSVFWLLHSELLIAGVAVQIKLAALSWLAADTNFAHALVLESLSQAARHIIFVMPAGLGVQEISFVALGQWLGVSGDAALAVSLAKRMSEILYGVPALLSWQWAEGRRMLRPQRSTNVRPR